MATKLITELLGADLRLQLLFLLLSFLLAFVFPILLHGKKSPRRELPPGPPRLPILGNLHQLHGELPHLSLRRLSDRYGPLMHLQLGAAPALVVSSAEMAQQVLKTHDLLFCDRPSIISWVKLTYGGLDLVGASCDDRWRLTRKLFMSELLSAKKVELSRPIREDEVDTLVGTIARLSSSGPVNLSEMFLCLFNNITRRQVSGRRVSVDGECKLSPWNHLFLEINSLLGGLSVGDLFPQLAWLDLLTSWHARLEKSFRDIDKFLDDEIDMHMTETGIGSTCGEEDGNFIRTLLRQRNDPALGLLLTRDKIKAILLDIFVAGSGTSMSSLEWAMSELVMNPRVMKKAQEELRRVAGTKEKVDEDDLQQLQYMRLVLKETWRLHPPGPLLAPHQCREDCNLFGYAVAKKTWVFVNVWAIGRDARHWREPEVFWPERFEDSSVDYKGQHFVLLPFSSGRRICPGMALGVLGVELALANLLLRFNWELPDGVGKHGLDMGEASGASTHRRSPLLLKATLASGNTLSQHTSASRSPKCTY